MKNLSLYSLHSSQPMWHSQDIFYFITITGTYMSSASADRCRTAHNSVVPLDLENAAVSGCARRRQNLKSHSQPGKVLFGLLSCPFLHVLACVQVLDRGERIELLVDKTDHLQNESFAFKREARRLKSRLWWKNTRLLVFLAVLVLIIAYIIVCFACSPTFQC